MKIVFLDTDSVGDTDLTPLSEQGELTRHTTRDAKQNLAAYIANADVIISNKVVIDEAVMQHAPNLKLICVAATGYNNVDTIAAKQRGIQVSNVAGYSTQSVAQHVMAMLLNWSIKLSQYQQAVANGDWPKSDLFCLLDYPIFELTGKTLGIIGYGAIGEATAKLAQAFGMKVIIAERRGSEQIREGRVAFDQLLALSDVISLHCPMTADNTEMVNAEFLSKMKPSGILINTARGGLVDEQALFKALNTKQIQAALLDCLSVEPPKPDHVLLRNTLPNLMITPHTAWASAPARQALINEIAQNIASFKQGEARNQVA